MAGKGARANSSTECTLLVVDDDPIILDVCKQVGESLGLKVRTTQTTAAALQIVDLSPVDLVLVDWRMPSMDGMALLEKVKKDHPEVEVILMTGYGSEETAVEAVKRGAFDYLSKPFHADDLRTKLLNALKQAELRRENFLLREQVRGKPGFGPLIGVSSKMKHVFRLIRKVSQSSCPVLILGESGTGKELVARSIHFQGARKEKPFLPVDCAGLVATLMESELFGYVKGAFTGATRTRAGLMEMAHGGTLFLDEVAELTVDMQAKLLRALQEKEVRPVGSTKRIPVDVRIVAATNRDLEASVRDGTFRQDLYYRLNVVRIKIPPLRERKSDIAHLTHHLLEQSPEGARRVEGVSEEAMARMMRYDWPGNVRELENVVQRALALGSDSILGLSDLPSSLNNPLNESPVFFRQQDEGIVPLRELERRAILRAVEEVSGDRILAARLLGIGKTTLYRKLKEYELDA